MMEFSPSPESLLLEDFGQKVDLSRRIREVLLNYPEGTTVLKELIQNADDAGATTVRLCLDRRSHGQESLLSGSLAQWQGPALIAFNDAVFTEEDFASISRIGGSAKHGQAWKTGRFGVGFNSVYHLTDLPSFVSGKYVVLFDPQGIYLPNVSAANPGKRIEYVSTSAISLYKDQFLPYCAFGCDMTSQFQGTLFRLPLRNADQAAKSRLSRQAYNEDDVCSMFHLLFKEGVSSLLFLKSVLIIEMYVWDSGYSVPRKLYSCSVKSADADTVSHRQLLLRLSRSPLSSCVVDHFKLDFLSEDIGGSNKQKRIDTFYIVQSMASGSSRISSFAATASKEYDIHLLPWASVAACLSHDAGSQNGQAFCFLPLPVRTGLSVHVNGYFEVSSNRRGIWYGEDMDRSGKVRSVWNKLLLEDVVAPSYKHLLLGVQEILGPSELYYSLWPSGDFEEPWSELVHCVYRNVVQEPVLFTDADGGKWVSPAEAFLHDEEFSSSQKLGHVLVLLGMTIVRLPFSLHDMLLKHMKDFQQKVVTPDSVRYFLCKCDSLELLGSDKRLLLLEYCLEDLVDSDVGKHAHNLPLLPLANGEYGSISEASKGPSYFICGDVSYELVKQISYKVIDPNIPGSILRRLSAIGELSGANVDVLNVEHFAQIFHEFVPSDWRYKTKVCWNLERDHNTYPTSSWFILFWQFLRRHCEDLSLFHDWPILPSTSGHLYRASRQSKFIKANELSENMKFVLEKIGCKILDQRYGVEHHDLFHYVSDATAPTVLDSIFNVVSSHDDISLTTILTLETKERDELRRFLLDPRWYIGGCMVGSSINNCRKLPIFKVCNGESVQDNQFSDLEEPGKYLPPVDVPNIFLGNEFLYSSSVTEDEILQRYYGVRRMGKAHFYRRQVFNHIGIIPPDDRNCIMISVLQDLPHLCIEDSFFKDSLRNIAFVPTSSGDAKCPMDLYDPRSDELYALLEESDLFPCGRFQEPEFLDVLQGLGLRTSVSLETVLQSARSTEQLMRKNPEKAYFRGKVLLSYMEANAHRWVVDPSNDDLRSLNRIISRATVAFRPRNLHSDLEKFWSDLRMICWCPVLVSAPHQALPWPIVSSTVAPPKLVRLRTDMWLVSASMRILDGECYSSALSHHLGWSSALGGSVIAAQILELGKNNEIVEDKAFRQELAMTMPRIYARLTELIGSDEMDIVKAVLEGCRWIWVGDGFATADEVVLSGPLHLAPYIRVIPIDLAVFKDLFLDLGVRKSLNFNDYASILWRMAARKEGMPLTSEELTGAIMIVQHLPEAKLIEKQMKIYLPDTSCVLLLASDLVYNDAPWLLGSDDSVAASDSDSLVSLSTKQTAHKFVHGNISNDVAEKLGVCSLRRLLLAESADSMNIGLSGAVEAFGQHEALTTRLKHILEMYADGPGILFELVQNAEDAGASEVIFMLDRTQYGTSSVLSPEMADWQGPALYCFNDSIFTPQDLYAISRIGQESKLEKPFAIGRFGLGFNCVYHFTDIPSFVSGDNIVMFDPHACNLPGVSPSHPGLRIRFMGRRILEQFPDQFSPFLHFGCDLQQSFPGTLFRFPLRSASIALRSHIKKEGYSAEDVLSLFMAFSDVISETLLFLHKVKSVSIYVKDGPTSDMQLLHRVDRNSVVGCKCEPHSAHHIFHSIHNRPADMRKEHFLTNLNRSVNKEMPWMSQKVIMKEQRSSNTTLHLWLMAESLGSIENCSKAKIKTGSCIPWASVAANLRSVEIRGELIDHSSDVSMASFLDIQQAQENSDQHCMLEGRAFCFLPLPINTGLPVHVNAYFELSSNRRDIWFGNDMSGGGKKRSDWNLHLLENVAAPAYGCLLEQMALEVGPCDLFFSFWPNKVGMEPWSSMVRKLYMFIVDSGIRVLYTKARGGRWISIKQAIFPDFAFDKMLLLVQALSEADLPIITIPQQLVERFMEVCPSLHYLTPQLLRTLLIRRKCVFNVRSALLLTLEYCLLDLENDSRPECLYGLFLIPLANGLCTAFSPKGVAERIYIARGEEYCLLEDAVPSHLVDKSIPTIVYHKLCSVASAENSNISFLSCHLLEKLFLRILPMDWQNAKQVTWVPGVGNHPSLEWMQLLWNYLKSDCNDLALFAKWPILPVGESHLHQLVLNSNIIETGVWSENISSVLQKAGCLFLRQDLQIEHLELQYYVQSATASGMANAFLAIAGKVENIEKLFSKASEGELHELRNFILQSKWFCEYGMDDLQIEVIKHIPMFECFRSRRLVSLSQGRKWLGPNNLREDLLDDSFVRAESDKERAIFKRYLNVEELQKVDFYKDFVLNRMSDFLHVPQAISAILCDIKLLVEEDASVKSVLSTSPFVLTSQGSWQQPNRLYDPRIPELKVLLHEDVFFPSDKFSKPEILDTLVGLGLKQSLTYSGLLDCASTVSILHDHGDLKSVMQGSRLFKCLDTLGSKLSADGEDTAVKIKNAISCVDETDGEEQSLSMSMNGGIWDCDAFLNFLEDDKPEESFWSELRTIAWCPVHADPPFKSLPWLNSTSLVAPPSSVRPKSQMWMVSSSMHILEAECCSLYIQEKMGWKDRPEADVLVTQLIELTKSYAQLMKESAVDPAFNAAIQEGICMLYSAMQEYIDTDEFMIFRSSLHGVSWIWIGDGFVTSSALAFDSPVKFSPYLYVVPSELSDFRDLLLALGVKICFDASDYLYVLQQLKSDVRGSPLSKDQLCFVICVLEAVAECYLDRSSVDVSNTPLLVPDSSGILVNVGELVYNDAPWMENTSSGRGFVHPSISNDLATRLGVQSLRCMSLVDDEMATDLPCMDYARIAELLMSYVSSEFLLFDLLELADCCATKKLHLIFDKRHHPVQTLLQHNLGEYQGPSLVAIFEGATLNREEISNLQLLPPWRLRGETINYGLGLLSCYYLCDLLSVLCGGCYYMFDPRGLVFSSPSSCSPAAKVFSFAGTNLMERFHDQFSPMLIGQEMGLVLSDCTVIRMPLSLDCMQEGPQDGCDKIKQLFDRLVAHGSQALIFLKSVMQVSILTWEEGNAVPSQEYMARIDSSSAPMRNLFPEKKWKKFHISRLFSSLSAATKIHATDQQKAMHVIDVSWSHGETKVADRWLIVLSFGSGQTRNMALDRCYLAYNLTPVAGVASLVFRNGHLADACFSGSVMSPLPLSVNIHMPVTILGYFLVRHNNGRCLFKVQDRLETQPDAGNQLIEAWNKELMSCVRDSYIELVSQLANARKSPHGSADDQRLKNSVWATLRACSDNIYSLWPRSNWQSLSDAPVESNMLISSKPSKEDWECVTERVIKPLYARLAELPVWQLYSGNHVRVEEGMFLSQPGSGVGDNLCPATVCSFVKKHYPVFSVPWDLIAEIQAVGVKVREIKPKMIRELLRVTSASIIIRSIEEYIDVLEYCLSDINFQDMSGLNMADSSSGSGSMNLSQADSMVSSSSIQGLHGILAHGPASPGGDALVMMSSFGRALIDFGRGVVEDIGRTGGQMTPDRNLVGASYTSSRYGSQLLAIAAELRGLPCPTAADHLVQLGQSEIWVGNSEEQMLVTPLLGKFVHLKVMDRPILVNIFSNPTLQSLLKIQKFSLQFLADNMMLIFHSNWVNRVINSNMTPWFSWENNASLTGESGPSADWIKLFWRNFSGSCEDLSLFSDWPLIPAFLGRTILCRVRERRLVFIPPAFSTDSETSAFNFSGSDDVLTGRYVDPSTLSETMRPYLIAFRYAQNRYPWLLSLLNQCNIPVYDPTFLDLAAQCNCLPVHGQSLGQVIASKLVAAKHAGHFPELASFLASDRDELFNLFASDFFSSSANYDREELGVLSALPIYRTVAGSYTRIHGQDLCIVASNSFLRPNNEHCLSYTMDSEEGAFLRALGVREMYDQQILLKFGLPGFESKTQAEQEDILIYIYTKWEDLQAVSSIVDRMKETNFVRSADEFSLVLSKPHELFDPGDSLVMSVFAGERKKFPGERFTTDGWIHILRKLGLKNATDAGVILECAKRVEFLGSEYMKTWNSCDYFDTDTFNPGGELSYDIWTLAESVLEAVFSNFAVLFSNSFCNALGQIACVPTQRGFPNMGGKRGGKRVLSSYSESIVSKDWPLAWSVAPVLSRPNVIPPEYSWGAFSLRSPPAFSTVLRHLKAVGGDGGEDTLAHWPVASNVMSVEDASCEVLKFLEKVWDSLSSPDIKELKKVAFLPAANGTRLVRADSLFVHLGVNLSPFAFELPSLYLPFVRILKDLGLHEYLSISSAKELLMHLQRSCGYQHLNPNEFRAVTESLHYIYEGLDDTKSERSDWQTEAVVPDDGCRLVHAKSCVYLDFHGSRFIKHVDCSRLRFVHPDIPEKICLSMGIKKLSDVVVEELYPEEHHNSMERIGSVSLSFIKQKLLSRSFQDATIEIVSSNASHICALNCLTSTKIRSLLEDTGKGLQFVSCIYSRFLLLPSLVDITYVPKDSTIPEWSIGPRHRTPYYVNRSKTQILVAEPPSYISVSELLAIVVSDILGLPTPLPLGSLLLCPEGSECLVVDALRFISAKEASRRMGSNTSEYVGKDVVAQDAHRVQLHPLRPFYAGEIIAWKPQNGERLKYGRVMENVRPSSGQPLYKLKVETAPGISGNLLSSQVFSFKSISVDREEVPSTSLTTSGESDAAVETKTNARVPDGYRRGKEKFSQTVQDGLQHDKLSPVEVVQAVQEMLSAAGVNMDAERQSLIQTNLTLQDQLMETQAVLLLEQDKVAAAAKETETAKAAWQCRICLAAEVEVSLIPCGHVLCRGCSSAVSRCPFCRLQVSKAMRIFRP